MLWAALAYAGGIVTGVLPVAATAVVAGGGDRLLRVRQLIFFVAAPWPLLRSVCRLCS